MIRTVELKEGTLRARSWRHRPSDPVWASASHLARVRERLMAHDPRVALWWAGSRGRWRIMEWLNSQGVWSHTLYWEGPGGEYRQPDATAMIRKLESIAIDTQTQADTVADESNRIMVANQRDFRAACDEYERDIEARALGVRQTFGPGRLRGRAWLNGEASGQHRKFVCEHLIRAWELRNGRRWEGGQ